MTDIKLKPCPFCGEMPKVNNWTLKGITDKRCFCDNEKCPVYLSKTIAIDDWNTRPIEDALNACIAELERRAARAKELLQDEMGDWLTVEAIYMPDHYLQLKQTIDVLDGGGE